MKIFSHAIFSHYIVRRSFDLVLVLLGISLVTFCLIQFMPSDPAVVILRAADVPTTPAAIAAMRSKLGLDRPLPIQYFDWLWRILHGDFGQSFLTGKPVIQEVMNYLPNTLMLLASTTALIALISLPVGILAACYRDSWFDQFSRLFAYTGTSIPNFWLGFLLLYLFSVKLGWLPITSRGSISGWILPAITLALAPAAVYARLLRASLLDSLGQNYVLYARSRGLTELRVMLNYGLKNAIFPVITMFGLGIGHLLAGTVVVENVFAVPGLGRFAVQSILNRDYPMVQCYVCLSAVMFVGVNFGVDLLYSYFDPRMRLGKQEVSS
jgi:nickel ABC transporter permease subunit NikB